MSKNEGGWVCPVHHKSSHGGGKANKGKTPQSRQWEDDDVDSPPVALRTRSRVPRTSQDGAPSVLGTEDASTRDDGQGVGAEASIPPADDDGRAADQREADPDHGSVEGDVSTQQHVDLGFRFAEPRPVGELRPKKYRPPQVVGTEGSEKVEEMGMDRRAPPLPGMDFNLQTYPLEHRGAVRALSLGIGGGEAPAGRPDHLVDRPS